MTHSILSDQDITVRGASATDVFYQDFVTLLSFFLSFSFYKECPSEGFFEDILSYPIPDGFGLIYNDV